MGDAVRHLCLDKGYDYPRVGEEHSRSRGRRSSGTLEESFPPLGSGAALAWLKGFRSLRTRYCYSLVNFMGLFYLMLACIL